jgi:hypothetical protein
VSVYAERKMGDCGEEGAQELPVPTAALHCPKCKGYARLASMVLDLRPVLRCLYQCDECGELIWDGEPEVSTARDRRLSKAAAI